MHDGRGSYESSTYDWNKISHSLKPEIDTLPERDRAYYKKVIFLIGKEIRLSNIPTKFMYIYIRWADWIFKILRYPMLFPDEFIRAEIGRYLNRLGLRISENGLGWKFGPMGFQQQTVKQEVITVDKGQGGT